MVASSGSIRMLRGAQGVLLFQLNHCLCALDSIFHVSYFISTSYIYIFNSEVTFDIQFLLEFSLH